MSHRETANAPHHVVVIGGGFGGLRAVQALKRAPVRVTLVDRRNHHVFQPLLYQVATGTLSPANICEPLRTVLRRQKNAEVLLGEVTGIDAQRHVVQLADRELAYDSLIVAAGARYNYFGQPWEQTAPSLKSVEDAIEIRRRILLALEQAEATESAEVRRRLLTFVIIGGGPTGVELAGALAEIARHGLSRDYRRARPEEVHILLVEGLDRILTGMPPELSTKAETALKKLGVDVRTGCRATQIEPDKVVMKCGEREETIALGNVFWTAGVRGSSLAERLAAATGCPLDRIGRVIVEPDLTVPGHPEIFVIGDLAHFAQQTGEPLPGVAPVAIQQGKHAARMIAARLVGQTIGPFHYRDYGNLATIGRSAAVADFHKVRFSGLLAWIAWLLVHLMQIVTFQNRVLVLIQWAWHYLTFNNSAQLITQMEREKGE